MWSVQHARIHSTPPAAAHRLHLFVQCLELPFFIAVRMLFPRSLSGSLPQRVAPSVFLTSLSLGSNNLSGRVPAGITQSTQLSKLDLSDNFMLTGTLPDMMWVLRCPAHTQRCIRHSQQRLLTATACCCMVPL
eukprot:GHRQ01037458.1.p2 GENE.GHRQ01037458.1~~GHRQ01037458.1.p2  ORF type:complete len:133 (-),score=27.92 GHRQ01037458.1:306-704(-)